MQSGTTVVGSPNYTVLLVFALHPLLLLNSGGFFLEMGSTCLASFVQRLACSVNMRSGRDHHVQASQAQASEI